MKKIIHIEDVDIVSQQVRKAVDDWFGEENIEIQIIDFEKAAENFIDRGEHQDIALIIVDLMVAYAPDAETEIPEAVLLEGSFDAGFRLIRKLKASPAWRDIPVVIYSSVDQVPVKEMGMQDVVCCQKTHTLEPLLMLIKNLTGLPRIQR